MAERQQRESHEVAKREELINETKKEKGGRAFWLFENKAAAVELAIKAVVSNVWRETQLV